MCQGVYTKRSYKAINKCYGSTRSYSCERVISRRTKRSYNCLIVSLTHLPATPPTLCTPITSAYIYMSATQETQIRCATSQKKHASKLKTSTRETQIRCATSQKKHASKLKTSVSKTYRLYPCRVPSPCSTTTCK